MMDHPGFWQKAGPFSLNEIVATGKAELRDFTKGDFEIKDIRPLDTAGPRDLSFFENVKYLPLFQNTKAGACIVSEQFAKHAPPGVILLISDEPYKDYARALKLFYPTSRFTQVANVDQRREGGFIHKTAVIEEGVRIEPGAVIGPEAHIGRGSVIAAGAVIGYRVYIGRDNYIGPSANVVHALLGDRVILHSGVRVGSDGFGFVPGRGGHFKVPQIGRVIIQDDVEIGANTTIDRGSLSDTVIGEGTKIDNLVQIAHNVVIGRHCLIVSQTGISGSTVLGDHVVMGGQSATVGHITIGDGTQVAANGKLMKSAEPGSKLGGVPAQPLSHWLKEVALLKKLRKDYESYKRRKD